MELSQVQKQSIISRTITVGELIGFTVTVFAVIVSSYVNIDKRITILEQEYSHEKEFREEIRDDVKIIKASQEQILIKLENKVDRKN